MPLPMMLMITAIIIFICVLFNKLSSKLGIPMLLAFIALGIFFGVDGVFKIYFEDYKFAENICSAALIFIMFYGGFGTKWEEAKPIAVQAVMLSSAGVILTAGITGLFCHYVLKFDMLESFLLGSVIGSTDAASVFSILRSKRLNLKYNTASMLEVESGSNDPCSYMLTVIILSLMQGGMDGASILYMIFAQLAYGALIGVIIAFLAIQMLKKFRFATDGFDAAFVLAVAVFSYALPTVLGGNGYLSAYIVGIILGNNEIKNKRSLVSFFDGFTGLMQMLIFFLLGLLSTPSRMVEIFPLAFIIAVFVTFISRPAAVTAILMPFRCKINQIVLVSWAGLRGAASIVFAIMVTVSDAYVKNDIFDIVFCIVLLSIAFQGTLIPFFSKKLNMVDDNADVLKTFNDYIDDDEVQFIQLNINGGHPWKNKKLKDIVLPNEMLIVSLLRGGETVIPKGNTEIVDGDTVVLSAPAFHGKADVTFSEISIGKNSGKKNKRIADLKYGKDELVVIIKRDNERIIPNGDTIIRENDILVVSSRT